MARRGQQKFDEQAYLRELQIQAAEQKRRKEVRSPNTHRQPCVRAKCEHVVVGKPQLPMQACERAAMQAARHRRLIPCAFFRLIA